MSEARAVMDRMTEAFLAGNLEGVRACYSSDAVLTSPEGTFKGREQIMEYHAEFLETFSEPEVTVERKAACENRALDEWSLSVTNTGPLELPTGEQVPATSKRVAIRGADVCTVEDGVITEHHEYFDQLELLGQLGLLPD